MGDLIAFPLQVVATTCFDCQHVFLGTTGSWCGCYEERIADESVATECSEFRSFDEPVETDGDETDPAG